MEVMHVSGACERSLDQGIEDEGRVFRLLLGARRRLQVPAHAATRDKACKQCGHEQSAQAVIEVPRVSSTPV
jgi:hypothetical protein